MSDVEDVVLSTGATGYFRSVQGRDTKGPAALVVHGWKSLSTSSTYTKLQDVLVEAGYNTLVLTLRGHEGAEGDIAKITRPQHLGDLYAAWTWLSHREDVDTKSIIGVGTSYGAYLLCSSEASNPSLSFAALCLRSPALYADDYWEYPMADLMDEEKLQRWRLRQHRVIDVLALQGIAVFTGPLLMVWGDADEQIPQNVFERYREVAGSERKKTLIISGAKHVLDRDQRELYLQQVSCWANNLNNSLRK